MSKNFDDAYRKWVESHNDGDVLYCKKAFIAGANWQKEKMLEDAVESEAEELYNDGEIHCTVGVGTYFKPGDEVYVIKKEDEK